MKILMINPNSSLQVTRKLDKEARSWSAVRQLCVDVEYVPTGPCEVITAKDELLAANSIFSILKEKQNGYDAAVIACFSDPGLAVAQEVLTIPVIGLCQAAFYRACLCARRFSVIASGGSGDITVFYDLARRYGVENKLASVRTMGMKIEELQDSIMDDLKIIIDKCVCQDGAQAIILGCAGFAGMGGILTREKDFPVFDGIKESLAFARMLGEDKLYQTERKCSKS